MNLTIKNIFNNKKITRINRYLTKKNFIKMKNNYSNKFNNNSIMNSIK